MKSLAAKVVVLIGLAVVLLLAVTSVRGVLQDRLRYREEALASVGRSLAGPQRIAGVVLVVPYVERWVEEQGSGADRRRTEQSSRHERIVLPDMFDLSGNLAPDPRRRGLFRVNGYVYAGELRGELRMPEAESFPRVRTGSTLEIGVPRLVLGVGDVRGLRAIEFEVDGAALEVQPGTAAWGSSRCCRSAGRRAWPWPRSGRIPRSAGRSCRSNAT
jgi:inner membrane protein